MPDYIAQLCARCDGLGYMHRDEDGDGIPVSMTDVPHRAALPGIEPCIACERCPDCGRDGTGPGVVWGALRRPWSREAAEAMLLSLLGRNWRSFCADDAEIEERIGDSIAALDAALAAQARRTEAKADDGPATHDR